MQRECDELLSNQDDFLEHMLGKMDLPFPGHQPKSQLKIATLRKFDKFMRGNPRMPTRSQKSAFSLFGEDFQNVLDEASDEDDADLNSDCGQQLRHDCF